MKISEKETFVLNIEMTESELTLQTVEILGRSETSYQNKSSFIGTKSATALKDVPQSIGYVTKELALDQGAFRVNDVVKISVVLISSLFTMISPSEVTESRDKKLLEI